MHCFSRPSAPGEGALWDAWEDAWREFSLAKGPLTHKDKDMMALGGAMINQHDLQIRLHVLTALEFGCSKEEVFEVMPITLLIDDAPALSQIPRVIGALEGG